MLRFLLLPVEHFTGALQRVLPERAWLALGAVLLGAATSWWVYVPVHELAHAFGCLATGGTVERLEIDAKYGAALLQPIFPFVAVGSDYAGQLTGFDTGGNDLIFLATDFAPFVLTLAVGVPLLIWLGRRARASAASSLLLGASLPVAFAPFANLAGDYYEMGSIVTTRITAGFVPGFDVKRWRSDDLVTLTRELLGEGTFRAADVAGLTAGSFLALGLAYLTYFAGAWLGAAVAGRGSGG